jgi:hypothetical protein
VVILFSLLLARKSNWVVAEIANRASLSISETHASIGRLEASGLISPLTRRPVMSAVSEFLFHGLKYAFPAEIGKQAARGMPTAHSAPLLSERIVGGNDSVYVWPCSYGTSRGIAVTPLYRTVPDAAQKSDDMYGLLSLADAICIGRVRERKLAEELLANKLDALAGDDL